MWLGLPCAASLLGICCEVRERGRRERSSSHGCDPLIAPDNPGFGHSDALIVQNAVCHEDGLGPLWETRRAFWSAADLVAQLTRDFLDSR
jgi:pimeloyl-ACP methyl ester carboxylesterase